MLATDWRHILGALPLIGRLDGDGALASVLMRDGVVRPADLRQLQADAAACLVPFALVLERSGQIDRAILAQAVADLAGMPLADLESHPPDPRLIDQFGAQRCLHLGVLPIRRVAGTVQVAIAVPAGWARLLPELKQVFGIVAPVHAPESALQTAIGATRGLGLRLAAESRVPAALSARSWPQALRGPVAPLAALACGALVLAWPSALVAGVLAWLLATLVATMALRATALGLAWRQRGTPEPAAGSTPLRLPMVSVLVPLYGEPDIAPRLLQRLGRLDYPRALLDVMIVLEAKDCTTRAALAAARLPGWMRVITVPDGPITTKPRAMNYALDFARGSIIGIYDAEDAPDPDQIRKVVQHFGDCGPDVACLQGALDYYNPRTNLIARLFTAEYASWFRVVMPALQWLGWPMPLGGTTLFVRRDALERVGAWDAHNVTEDADLGVRLARHGLRTEMLRSTTHEEANCRVRPWISQRSRWIKGHILTWAVHMRDPRGLWRDLGPWGFIGYQVVFLGAQSQVLLAPVMWSFWVMPLGIWHPVQALLPGVAVAGLVGLFVLAEMLVIATAVVGLSRTRHRRMGLWAPLLHGYHPMGAIAGWRALWEAFANPFYWAKTSHGHFDMAEATSGLSQADPRQVLVSPPPAAPEDAWHPPRSAADRVARTLALAEPVAPAPDPDPGRPLSPFRPGREVLSARLQAKDAALPLTPPPDQRVRTSPASIFSRVSNAREICARNAS